MTTRKPGLCFDATGTLMELREDVGEVYRRIALDFGVDLPAWRLEDAFRRILARSGQPVAQGETESARVAAEKAGWFDLIRQVFQATDSTVRFADFSDFAGTLFEHYASDAAWRVRGAPGALRAFLTDLKRAGYPMTVVSNFDHRLEKILQDIDLESFFESLSIPSIVGQAKPDEAPFLAAADALDRSLDELVYLGDDSDDTLNAIEALGVRTIAVGGPGRDHLGWNDLRDRFDLPATLSP